MAARFDESVRRAVTAAGDRPVVVGTHGMAMTLWLVSVGVVEDPVAFWETLQFPDVVPVSGWSDQADG